MNAMIIRACLTISLSIVAAPAWSATDDQKVLVDEVLRLSGLEQHIQQMPQQLLSGYDQERRQLPVEQHTAVRLALATSFDATVLSRQIRRNLEASLRPETIRTTIRWLKTDLGKKVTRLEGIASETKTQRSIQAFAMQLEKSPPSQERLQLIRRIDQASNGSELLLDLSESLILGLASAHEATLPSSQRMGLDRVRNQIARQRETLRQQVQTHVWVSLLFAYRSLPQAELRQYTEFLESEDTRSFYAHANKALKGALETGITRVSGAMIDIFKPPAGRKAV